MATADQHAPTPHDPAPEPDDTLGPIRRGLLGLLLAAAVLVPAAVALSDDLSVPMRIFGMSFSLLGISLAGMTVKIWGEPHLRELYFSNPMGSNLTRISKFLAHYRERFGADLWSTLFLGSAAAALLSAMFLASIQK